jgi:NAD(P)-dependent dehydrogenase (short-subunit alcohol dehydrogenase family)
MYNFKDKHYLILAASSDLGLALCQLLKTNGAKLTVHGNTHVKLLSDYDLVIKHDFLLDDIDLFYGKINLFQYDGIISFLGKAYFDFAKTMTQKSLEECLHINYTANALIVNKLVSNLNENASILFCSSGTAESGEIGMSHYTASKAALIGLMRSLIKELSNKKIRVNIISPSLVQTRGMAKIPNTIIENYIKQNPLKRIAEPSDIAQLASFLLSDQSTYINGQNISISGGHEFLR